MDLITYLKNTENEELIEKLKKIVKLYKEREENHKELIDLNKEYNEFLTKKHEKEFNEKKDDKSIKPKMFNPFLLFIILIMLPSPIVIIACISLNLFALVKLVKEKDKIKSKLTNDFF